jgi:5'-nucleotidase
VSASASTNHDFVYCERVRQKTMKILVSNDDGYLATGINVLTDALARVAEVVVIAPDRNRSAASNSLTLHNPLRVSEVAENRYKVDGTPSDCVHLALTGFLDFEPDLVVSGINHGANLGDDVIYSGTVAAAMEGRFLGLPTIAVSLVGQKLVHFETAAQVASALVQQIERAPLASDVVLNVNVPNIPHDELRGVTATRLGFRHKAEQILRDTDPYGQPIYWVGPAGEGQDAGEGTDFYAVERGYASVTPLKVDLTRHAAVADLSEWLGSVQP